MLHIVNLYKHVHLLIHRVKPVLLMYQDDDKLDNSKSYSCNPIEPPIGSVIWLNSWNKPILLGVYLTVPSLSEGFMSLWVMPLSCTYNLTKSLGGRVHTTQRLFILHLWQYLGKGTNYVKSKMYSRAQTPTKKFLLLFFFYSPTNILWHPLMVSLHTMVP